MDDVPRCDRFILGYSSEGCIEKALDVLAGNVKRAPKWMIACKLEWLYRLIKEPWRFKRMISLPFFLLSVKK